MSRRIIRWVVTLLALSPLGGTVAADDPWRAVSNFPSADAVPAVTLGRPQSLTGKEIATAADEYLGRGMAPVSYNEPGESLLPPPSDLQLLTCTLLTLHFIKRELETIFIHRFSLATMPVRNIFKNSGHYWILAGLNVAYWVYAPTSPAGQTKANPLLLYPGLVLFVFGELANLSSPFLSRKLSLVPPQANK